MPDISQDTIQQAGLSPQDLVYSDIIRAYGKKGEALKASAESMGRIGELQATKQAALAPKIDEAARVAGEAPPEAPKLEKTPGYERPTVAPDEIKESFGMLLATALLVGVSSRQPYYDAMAAMTGAMKGWQAKDEEIVKDSLASFDRNVAAIKSRNDAARADFDLAWKKYQNDLPRLNQEIQILSAKYDMPIAAEQANRGAIEDRIKGLDNQIKSGETTLTKLMDISQRAASAHEATMERAEAARQHSEAMLAIAGIGGGAGTGTAPISTQDMYQTAAKFGLTPEGFEKAVDRLNVGDASVLPSRSMKTLPLITAMYNRVAQKYPDSNIPANRAQMGAIKTALTQTVNREAAVHRITGAIKELESRLIELNTKINNNIGGQFLNRNINELITQFGDDPDLAELRRLTMAVGREYMAAVTMPGSAAQMHVGAQEEAERMMNANIPPKMLAGAIKGINEDIAASDTALSNEEERLIGKLHTISVPVNPEAGKITSGGSATRQTPATPGGWTDEKEQRYQELKAKQNAAQ